MIRNLNIAKFGKFSQRVFSLSPVTLIYGRNEAGKTTLFDALTEGLCSPKGSTDAGRRIRERYGADRKVSLDFDGEPLSLSAFDFLNLFAVRSGIISLSIDTNSEWMNQVKAELFSGGIDPAAVAKKLDDDTKKKSRGSLLSQVSLLEGELKAMRSELAEASSERESCLAAEKEIGDREAKRSAAKAGIESLGREVETLSLSLEQQNLIRERKLLLSVLGVAAEKRKTSEELERYSGLSAESFSGLKAKSREIQEQNSRAEAARALLHGAENELSRLLSEKAEAERAKGKWDGRRLSAELVRTGLGREEDLIDKKNRNRPPPALRSRGSFFSFPQFRSFSLPAS